MVMTAKVDFKKILMILAAAAALILAAVLLFGGEPQAQSTSAAVSTNDGRVQFLKNYGWEVTTSPAQSSQVRIPEQTGGVYHRYNALQQSQGYDLTEYAGKNVMRFVYTVNNYPGATEPVYATLLVYKNKIIGGDITDTAPGGKIHGFQPPQATIPQATTPATQPAPTETTAESTGAV